MKTLITSSLCFLALTLASAAQANPGDFEQGRFDHGRFEHGRLDRDHNHYRPLLACTEIDANVQRAQATVNMSAMNLPNLGNLCGGNMACVVMYQNAYNQQVVALQQAQELQQRYHQAQFDLNNAQNGVNLATATLINVLNICGNGNYACIVTAQNAYNQSLASLQRSQEILRGICY